jgi:ATP-dependent DNA helicase RecQ
LQRINVSAGRIDKAIQLLSLESPAPIVKEGKKWQLTAATLQESFWDRAERLTRLRKQEQKQMETYVRLSFGQHMGFLLSALDGDPNDASPPKLPPLPESVSPEYLQKAHEFVKHTPFEIEPRKMWPSGGMQKYGAKGAIPLSFQAQVGKVLCVWGDSGWGESVRQGKYRDVRFGDELVIACQELFLAWHPVPAPSWVTCVPSRRHPTLVPDFAERLAQALQLPFHEVLIQTVDRPEQKSMQNSAQQARNLDGSITFREGSLALPEPVLLIDDMVDSRWTLTVCAWLLRQHGCGEVWPLALAQTGNDS